MEFLGKLFLGALLLGCQVSSSSPPDQDKSGQQQGSIESSAQWHGLLLCGRTKTTDCREKLEDAKNSPSPSVSNLAKLLLDEWPLPDYSRALSNPRAIEPYTPDWEILQSGSRNEWFVFVADLVINAEGVVQSVSILRSSGDKRLDADLVDGLRAVRFRPAVLRGKYVSGNTLISISPDFT